MGKGKFYQIVENQSITTITNRPCEFSPLRIVEKSYLCSQKSKSMKKEKEKKALQLAQIDRLKSVISELGITQSKFAAEIGVRNETISVVVNGKQSISEGMAAKIGLKYRINPQWLLYGEGQKYNETGTGQLQRQNQLKQIAAIKETLLQLSEQLDELEKEVTK